MKTYRKLIKKPSTFRQLTGLSVSEFEELLGKLDIVWKEKRDWKNQRSKRRRKPGGGRHPSLALAERLTILLMYYRTYITQEFLGFLFGVDKGTVCRNVQEIALLLTGIFRIPEKRVEISADEIAEAFVDATEQPVNRPKKKQRRSYSGKKTAHDQASNRRGAQAEEETGRPEGEAETADRGGSEGGEG